MTEERIVEGYVERIEPKEGKRPAKIWIDPYGKAKSFPVATWKSIPKEIEEDDIKVKLKVRMEVNGDYTNYVLLDVLSVAPAGENLPKDIPASETFKNDFPVGNMPEAKKDNEVFEKAFPPMKDDVKKAKLEMAQDFRVPPLTKEAILVENLGIAVKAFHAVFGEEPEVDKETALDCGFAFEEIVSCAITLTIDDLKNIRVSNIRNREMQ